MIWDMDWEGFLRLALDYLRAVLSGPVVIGAVIVFFLLKFKPSVNALLAKLASLEGPGGFKASFVDQERAAEDVKKIQEQAHVQIQEQEGQDRAQVQVQERAQVQVQGEPQAPADQTWQNVAVEFGKWWAFERLFRSIFLSQILLLRHLAALPNKTARWTELLQFYQQGMLAKGVQAVQYPFENYMRFLQNAGLITWTLHAGAAEADVTLTQLGQEFLNYLHSMNYNAFERPY